VCIRGRNGRLEDEDEVAVVFEEVLVVAEALLWLVVVVGGV
jgi:hypothetical protein